MPALEFLPTVCVLYSDNYRENYFPKKAQASLLGKAASTFVKVRDFNANTVAMKVLEIQQEEKRPQYIAVDIPNDATNVDEFASQIQMLGEARSRNVFFGSVKNAAATDETFYANQRVPIVEWQSIRECQRFNGDEIVRQQNKKKPKENFFVWVLRQWPFSKEAGLRL